MFFFFFNDTATTEIYTLSLHDALPIYGARRHVGVELLRHPDADRDLDLGMLSLDERRRLDEIFPRHRSEEHTSELQSRLHLVCRLLLEKKNRQVFRYPCPLCSSLPPSH